MNTYNEREKERERERRSLNVRQAQRGQIEIILLCLIAIEESGPAIVRSRTPISEINLLINIPSLRE